MSSANETIAFVLLMIGALVMAPGWTVLCFMLLRTLRGRGRKSGDSTPREYLSEIGRKGAAAQRSARRVQNAKHDALAFAMLTRLAAASPSPIRPRKDVVADVRAARAARKAA